MKRKALTVEMYAEETAALLKTLAHPVRLTICSQLQGQEMSVGDMEINLGLKQPRLSRELAKLREGGFVETRRDARVIFYRLSKDIHIQAMINAVCKVMLGEHDVGGSVPKLLQRECWLGGYGVFARMAAVPDTGLHGGT